MLAALRIRDLGVISDVEIELSPGLCVVTGETGAGKTMVVTGLQLLFGGRADASRVRAGAAQASVDGRLRVAADSPAARRATDAGGEVDDGELVLRRVLTATGRSRAHVGGTTAPVGVLSAIGNDVVTVHGQADQMRLARPGEQRGVLDRFAGIDLAPYRAAFEDWQEAGEQLARRTQERAALSREADSLRFGLAEIEGVGPAADEDIQLAVEAARLGAADELRLASRTAHDALLGDADNPVSDAADVGTLLGTALRTVQASADADPRLGELAARLHELAAMAADVGAELADYADQIDADPARLAAVEQRRADLSALTRKYGTGLGRDGSGGIATVLAWAQEASGRLLDVDTSDDAMAQLAGRADEAQLRAARLADDISTARRRAAGTLSERVSEELTGLAMSHAQLEVRVSPRPPTAGLPTLHSCGPNAAPAGATADGTDEVEFLLRPRADSPALPLGRGASGGELSRVMLALEVVLAGSDPVPVMVFDEVDAGVGGRAAVEVGRRLARLGQRHQVIVVTHLPQVAAFADAHFVVGAVDVAAADAAAGAAAAAGGAGSEGSGDVSSVVRVQDDAQIAELARMLAGRDTGAAREHAGELVADAQRYRREQRAAP